METSVIKHARLDRPISWTAGPDWFRWKVGTMNDARRVEEAARSIQTNDFSRGSKLQKWSFQGYRGWASDSIRWGRKDWNLIWETSGESTPFTLTAMPTSSGLCKRLDLQVTLCYSTPQLSFGAKCLKYSTPTKSRRRSTRSRVGVTTRTDGLFIGTVGTRTGHSYWRVYDKGVESKTAAPGLKWRLELETKYSLAETLCKENPSVLTSLESCASYCVQSWRSQGFSWPADEPTGSSKNVVAPRRPQPSAIALANWLSLTVAPTMPRLLAVFSANEILQMLGLQDVCSPKRSENARSQLSSDDWSRHTRTPDNDPL
jgi:hypothetical protein